MNFKLWLELSFNDAQWRQTRDTVFKMILEAKPFKNPKDHELIIRALTSLQHPDLIPFIRKLRLLRPTREDIGYNTRPISQGLTIGSVLAMKNQENDPNYQSFSRKLNAYRDTLESIYNALEGLEPFHGNWPGIEPLKSPRKTPTVTY